MRLRRSRGSGGFTLIELMVVIAIIAVLASISVGVYLKQINRGHVAATQSLIQGLNDALQERVDAFFKVTAYASTPARHANLANGSLIAGTQTGELPAIIIAKREALIAKLDAMRGEFPQQFIDFMRSDIGGATTSDEGTHPTTSITYTGLALPNSSNKSRSAIYMAYLERTISAESYARDSANPHQVSSAHPYNPTNGTGGGQNGLTNGYSPIPLRKNADGSAPTIPHDPGTESSECLYLLLTTTSSAIGSFNPEQIDPRFVRDTDNDGLMEFVDSWDNPLRFYRWPTDYLEYLITIQGALPTSLTNRNSVDPEGLLGRDLWYNHTGVRTTFEGGDTNFGTYFRLHALYGNMSLSPPTYNLSADEADVAQKRSYPLLPLIVSAGPDGAGTSNVDRWRSFGLAWPNDGSTPTAANLSARSARVGGSTNTAGVFTPDAELLEKVSDNIVSLLIRSGQGN